ncbi:MAG TPA: aminotransferase class V-fold PLP-dependent enzyme, partial [Thermomicrobiales bacterium]|nr:aminotransferase class V-fold PLP-dependent enzyme [Thermomicrobiales bacterium]
MTTGLGDANGTGISAARSTTSIDGAALRTDFPIFRNAVVGGRPLTFLDSAASSQKPQVVIDALRDYYETSNANIHRGVYHLSEIATAQYEEARTRIARFINAASPRECIFVRGTTEGINLVASSWGRANLKPGDLIVYTEMEHHSNIIPWQLIAEQTGARIAWVPMTPDGQLDRFAFSALMAQ